MARMINALTSKSTPGEAKLFGLLKERLPDDNWAVLYNQVINNYESDFVIISRERGVLVVEVKDWGAETINDLSESGEWDVVMGGQRVRKNPYKQVREYSQRIRGLLGRDGRFANSDGEHEGKLKVPVGHAVVFPNMTRHDLLNRFPNAATAVPFLTTVFADELESTSEVFQNRIFDLIDESAPFYLREPFGNEEFNDLVLVLAPSVSSEAAAAPRRLEQLDAQQRMLAERNELFGHSVIEGVVGSGKTLVLVHRALFLKAHWPKRRILITCFNVLLAQYIRSLLERASPDGKVPEGIDVSNFHSLVYKFIGPYDEKSGEYVRPMNDAVMGLEEEQRYDTLLIDEGQDLQPEWVRILVGMVKKKGDVIFAHDPIQGVYGRRRFDWKDVGFDLSVATSHSRRRIFTLLRSYRNTREIVGCAAGFVGKQLSHVDADAHGGTMPFLELCGDSYKKPVLVKVSQVTEMMRFIAEAILKLRALDAELSWSDFGILLSDFKYARTDGTEEYLSTDLSKFLGEQFGKNFLAVFDKEAKRSYRHFADSMKLLRLDACKGLEWKVVFLIGLDRMPRPGRQPDDELAAAYVGLTRATRLLLMPYTMKDGGYIPRIEGACDPLNKDLWGDVTNI